MTHTPGDLHARQDFANRWRLEQHRGDAVPLCVAVVSNTQCEVGSMDDAAVAANAARLAACWNAHDALLAALTLARAQLGDLFDVMYGSNLQIYGWHLNGDPEPVDSFFDDNLDADILETLDAIIAKARGGAG